ncbi:tetratricopeptide repeat-containing glycosyltransferase [Ottowia thiooxydans]|uniref:tetratricopeptide repeat-containing glycosyltransferase n=1 Tax=Ottowia thiooxydans TaxID=219182 RepID=UPI000414988A|nr:glycosyltransferase family 2 protein [Ottowia thiooxydans]
MQICLNMIVKDEAGVIERCLASVKPFIHHWVIVDTGSTDGTQDIIRRFMAGIPGELHERPWRNFGHNRTEAIELARGQGDYVLIMDADNSFHAPPDWKWPALTEPAYYLQIDSSGTHYQQCLLVSNTLPWRWVGVLHEYLATEKPYAVATLNGPWVVRRHEGARSRDPLTFRKDAALLEQGLRDEPGNVRYVFYLAQSWRDAGEPEKARQAYLERARMGGWAEEVWYSLFQAAVLAERLGLADAEVQVAYMAAYQYRPSRIEPLVALARWHNRRQEWAMAQLYARAAMALPTPADLLFMDESAYRWGAIDEAAIAAFWAGDHEESFRLCMLLLDGDLLPELHRQRLEANRDFAAPTVAARTTQYPAAIVERLVAQMGSADAAQADVTFTVTTCKRLDLFERTMNSFLNCCQDLNRIQRFVCADDNSSEEDRQRMREIYPFFEFIFKGPEDKGHARSMNLLRAEVHTTYWLHMEDDWEFLVSTPYVERAVEVLQAEPGVAQVLFNRNYAETLPARALVGGFPRKHSLSGRRYVLHEHWPAHMHAEFFARHPAGVLSNMWWPHFSLQPSLMDAKKIQSLGEFDVRPGHFEREFAGRFMSAGNATAFLDLVACQHIGRLISEKFSGTLNAYDLNGVQQF